MSASSGVECLDDLLDVFFFFLGGGLLGVSCMVLQTSSTVL